MITPNPDYLLRMFFAFPLFILISIFMLFFIPPRMQRRTRNTRTPIIMYMIITSCVVPILVSLLFKFIFAVHVLFILVFLLSRLHVYYIIYMTLYAKLLVNDYCFQYLLTLLVMCYVTVLFIKIICREMFLIILLSYLICTKSAYLNEVIPVPYIDFLIRGMLVYSCRK